MPENTKIVSVLFQSFSTPLLSIILFLSMARSTKAYLALIFICITWGTTYLAIKVGVMHYPAFLFAGVRQFVSGILLMAIGLAMNRKTDLSWSNIRHHMLVGFLLITVGNGLVTWAEKYVPSGVAALICGMMPIIAVLINVLLAKDEKLNVLIVLGMLLGFGGVGLIFRDNIADLTNSSYLLGITGLLLATSSWALGSVINKKRSSYVNPVFNSGSQLLFGGLFLLLASPAIDDYSDFTLWNAEGFWSLVYLIIFGSILAYTAYMYALKELPVGVVTTYAYVNPLVAVVLGYFILSEPLTWFTALSFVTIVTGVFLVNRGYQKQKTKDKKITDFGNNAVSALPAEAVIDNK